MNTVSIEIIGSGDTPTESRFAVDNNEVLDRIRRTLVGLLDDTARRDEWPKFRVELDNLSTRTAEEDRP